jgi:hypothetical protein
MQAASMIRTATVNHAGPAAQCASSKQLCGHLVDVLPCSWLELTPFAPDLAIVLYHLPTTVWMGHR